MLVTWPGAAGAQQSELTPLRKGEAACRAADGLRSARRLADAHAKYVAAIELGYCQRGVTALVGIAIAQKEAADEYRQGLKFVAEDENEEAIKHFNAALAIDAGHAEARKQLETLASEVPVPTPDLWQELGKIADDLYEDLRDAGSFLAVILAIVGLVALLLLFTVARVPLIRHWGRKLGEIERARPHAGARSSLRRKSSDLVRSSAAWIWGTSVRVESMSAGKEDELRPTVNGLIGGSMGLGDSGVDLATGESGTDLVEELATAIKDVPHGRVVATLLPLVRKSLPRAAYFVRVQSLTDEGEQPGVSVSLATRRSIVRAADVLWGADFTGGHVAAKGEKAVPVLAIAAAAWADYAILAHRDRLDVAELVRGTRDWRSYALFRVGVEQQRAGRYDAAHALYAEALDHDATNWPALFNLAVCDLRRGEVDQARRRFETVAAKTRAKSDRGFETAHPLWYTAMYNAAAAQLTLRSHAFVNTVLGPLLDRIATDLERLTEIQGDRAQRRPAQRAARERQRLLERVLAPALVMWADAAGVDYYKAASAAENPGSRPPLRTILEPHAGQPPGLPLLRYAAAAPIAPRTAYNLACLFTSSARSYPAAFGRALAFLRDAAEVPALAAWARRDPSLAYLRAKRPTAFADALARRSLADVETPLAGVQVIGADRARVLAERGIAAPTPLVDACQRASDRNALAAELGVSAALVDRWARLAEVMVGLELDAPEANLLDAARHGSHDALVGATPASLHQLLADLHTLDGFGADAPTEVRVGEWVADAKKMKSRVWS